MPLAASLIAIGVFPLSEQRWLDGEDTETISGFPASNSLCLHIVRKEFIIL